MKSKFLSRLTYLETFEIFCVKCGVYRRTWRSRCGEAVALGFRGLLSIGVVLGAVLGGGALENCIQDMPIQLQDLHSLKV